MCVCARARARAVHVGMSARPGTLAGAPALRKMTTDSEEAMLLAALGSVQRFEEGEVRLAWGEPRGRHGLPLGRAPARAGAHC